MTQRFVVVARKLSGTIEFADLGDRAQITYLGQAQVVDGQRAGSALWEAMVTAGVNPQSVNSFAVYQSDVDGPVVAYVHAVLDGARVVWLVLYRADRAASAFQPIGSRQRIADALDACFRRVVDEIRLPHKP